MAEVVYEGTERKEPDGMTMGSSPSPAVFTGFLLQVTSRQLEKKGRDTDNKSFFFLKENIGILLCQWEQSQKKEMLMMQAKGCVTLRRGTIQTVFRGVIWWLKYFIHL